MPNLHLCDLDLNKNALLNPVIHPVGTAPSNPVEGQIYYDNTGGDKQIYVYNGSGWISMGGDVTSVIAGTGLTGGGTGGAVTLNVIGGTGITANANDIAIDSTVATLSGSQTLTNKTIAASQVTEISNLTAAEGAQLEAIGTTTISATQWGYLGAATGAITNTDTQLSTEAVQDIVGAMTTSNTESGITVAYQDADGTLDFTVGTLNQNTTGSAATLTTARTIGGVSFNGSANIDLPGVNTAGNQATSGNAATATKISSITNSNIVQLAASQTLTNKTIAASQVTEISNITAAEGAQIENIGTTTISATQWGYLGAASGAITNTNTQLSQAQVEDFAGGLFTGNTETGITATYQAADNTVDLVVGTLNQDTTGNAATASALDHNIAIYGNDTNGSGDVSGTIIISGIMLDGNNISGIDDSGEFTDNDAHIMTSAGINDRFAQINAPNATFSPSGSTDGAFQGDVVYFGGTTSMTVGTIYNYKSDGTWEAADADDVATSDGLLAVALGAASDTNGMLLRGMVTLDHDPGAIGDVLFLSTTAGDASATAPSGSGDIVRVIGYQVNHASQGEIWFNPDSTFVEIA